MIEIGLALAGVFILAALLLIARHHRKKNDARRARFARLEAQARIQSERHRADRNRGIIPERNKTPTLTDPTVFDLRDNAKPPTT